MKQEVPAGQYRKSPRRWPGGKSALIYPENREQRQVRSNGQIKWQNRKRFIGEAFIGYPVSLKPIGKAVHAVYFGHILIGHLHDNDPGGMRPAVYKHRSTVPQKNKV